MHFTVTHIARVCHDANRSLCMAFGHEPTEPWDTATDAQRASTLRGVQYALDHPNATPRSQHEAWMKDRLADGWAYAPVTDKPAKKHACFMDYDQLPAEQRVKDHVFQAIVRAFKEV